MRNIRPSFGDRRGAAGFGLNERVGHRANGIAAARATLVGVVLLAAALAIVVVAATWVVQGRPLVGWFSDTIDYLMVSNYIRDVYLGAAQSDYAGFFRETRFPPLWPLVLAAFGATPDRPSAAFIANAVMVALATVLFFAWARVALARFATAAWLTLVLVLTPEFLLQLVTPASEPLMIVLLVAAFAIAERDRDGSRLLATAALVGLTPLARSAAMPLLLAFVVYALAMRPAPMGRRWFAIVVALLPTVAWTARRITMGAQDYGQQWTGAARWDSIGAWAADAPLNVWFGFASLVDPFGRPYAQVVLGLVALFALVGFLPRLRALKLDALFLPLYLGTLLLWPFPVESARLSIVVWPIVLVHAALGAHHVFSRLSRSTWPANVVPAALVLVVSLVSLAPGLLRAAFAPREAELEPYARRVPYLLTPDNAQARRFLHDDAAFVATVRALPRYLESSDCVYSATPSIVWTIARVGSSMLPDGYDTFEAEQLLTQCSYILLTRAGSDQQRFGLVELSQLYDDWTDVVHESRDLPRGESSVVLFRRRAP